MSRRAHGQVRRSQVITTWGPGALLDLPRHSGIVGGLETWPKLADLDEITDPRLTRKLAAMTGLPLPQLFAPPADSSDPTVTKLGIGVYRFPEWHLVQEGTGESEGPKRSRRLVHRKALDDKGRFDGNRVVPTRFVRACPRGHVDDLNWHRFVHHGEDTCKRQLWLDEVGTGGDLADLVVRCECKESRRMSNAAALELKPLGTCRGARPWLGRHANEDCSQPARLLIRTAANAFFPQILSVLSLPDTRSELEAEVEKLWDDLHIVEDKPGLGFIKKKPQVAQVLGKYKDDDVLEAIKHLKHGSTTERPVKEVELEALLDAPEGFGDDVPVDPNFHARRLPQQVWKHSALSDSVAAVIQLHRLREILALSGFTRLEAVTPDIHGEYESYVERASLAVEPSWFPAVENRGEGVFLQVKGEAVTDWQQRDAVKSRVDELAEGHQRWADDRDSQRPFAGGPYVLLHTLAHLLMQSLSMRCGYPASSIRERIYVHPQSQLFGLLLYTSSPDAEGTLGGLVQQARHVETHLASALSAGALCSNDPVCAQHSPGESMEGRWLLGAACHGCSLVSETSCEMRNDYLDRALVVPTLAVPEAAFFPSVQ